ncbi:MAG TPA: hypothetical protein VK879_05410 [Candidatus Sulfomarinibacteraceae bacterium]|nr:hypothetical protein [Candidatus Sulfomarinibacteraceae bacterium]
MTFNWILLALLPLVAAGTYITSSAEEGLLREKSGAVFEDYAQQTNRFIPELWC